MADWIPWPRAVGRLFRTGTACDMLIGPCSCGATHTAEQIAGEVLLAREAKCAVQHHPVSDTSPCGGADRRYLENLQAGRKEKP